MSVSQIAQVLLNGTDVMIVGALLGPAAVVPYACTGKLVSVLANQPQAILQSAAPALSELRTTNDRGRLFQVSSALAQATLAVSGLVACVVLAVNAGFVRWWVGPEQFGGLALTLLLLAAMIIRHFNTTNIYALFCFGHERRLALTGLADGVTTLVISALLVRSFGLAGAPLGAIAGVVLVSAPLNLAELSRETGVSRGHIVATLGAVGVALRGGGGRRRADRRLDPARVVRAPGDPRRGRRPVLRARGRRSAAALARRRVSAAAAGARQGRRSRDRLAWTRQPLDDAVMERAGDIRVAHLVPAPFDPEDGIIGGAERYSFELARHMAERVPTELISFGPRERTRDGWQPARPGAPRALRARPADQPDLRCSCGARSATRPSCTAISSTCWRAASRRCARGCGGGACS